jgi:hypothetical protein
MRKQTKHSNQPADSNGDEKDLSSEMSEEGKLGFDPRKRHFDVDRILEEAARSKESSADSDTNKCRSRI